MKPRGIRKFSLQTIADAVSGSDVRSARSDLSFAVGAILDVSGKVQKLIRRDEQCKLMIEPGDVPGFVVFADCRTDAETVKARKIRKGSAVSIRGKLLSFGVRAVCLFDCKLAGKTEREQKKRQGCIVDTVDTKKAKIVRIGHLEKGNSRKFALKNSERAAET